jgi:hypothetical protein
MFLCIFAGSIEHHVAVATLFTYLHSCLVSTLHPSAKEKRLCMYTVIQYLQTVHAYYIIASHANSTLFIWPTSTLQNVWCLYDKF